jgi:hypothetical protein
MSATKKQKPVSIRQEVLIQKIENCAEFFFSEIDIFT